MTWIYGSIFAAALLAVWTVEIGEIRRTIREALKSQTSELSGRLEVLERRLSELDGIEQRAMREFNDIERQLGKLDGIERRLGKLDGIELRHKMLDDLLPLYAGKLDGIEDRLGQIDPR